MQLTSDDLFSGLSMLALWLLVAGLVVAFSIARARRRGSTTLALDVTRNASFIYLIFVVLGVVASGLNVLGRSSLALDDDVRSWVVERQGSLLTPACDESGPVEPDPVVGPVPMTFCDGWIENAPLAPRVVIYLGTLLGLLASSAIAWAIYAATHRASQRDPFHPVVSKWFAVASVVVMVCGALSELVTSVGMTLTARSLKWTDDVQIPFQLSIPLWPFAVAVGLFALSAIFRYGAVLQRETEGLV